MWSDKEELRHLHEAIADLVRAVDRLARQQHRLIELLEPKSYPATAAIAVSVS